MSLIMLADHDEARGMATVDDLMSAGHAVACFAGADRLLEAIRFRLPHLLVLDADLPAGGTAAVLDAVRREGELATLPVMLLAVRSAIERGQRGQFREADAVLVRSPPAMTLVSQAERLIRRAASDRVGLERIAAAGGMGARLPLTPTATIRFC